MASRYSQPAPSSAPGPSASSSRSSMMSTSQRPSGTYPISPSPTSNLPSQTYPSRNRLTSIPAGGPVSYLARTPSTAGSIAGSSATGNTNTTAPTASSTSSTLPDLLERPRDKTKNSQVAASSLAFLYAEMVSYTQSRVSGIGELEKKLSLLGYHLGQRFLPLLHARLESPTGGGSASSSKNPKREIRLLPMLLWVHGQAWKALFGKAADSLERSTERSDECECLDGLEDRLVVSIHG